MLEAAIREVAHGEAADALASTAKAGPGGGPARPTAAPPSSEGGGTAADNTARATAIEFVDATLGRLRNAQTEVQKLQDEFRKDALKNTHALSEEAALRLHSMLRAERDAQLAALHDKLVDHFTAKAAIERAVVRAIAQANVALQTYRDFNKKIHTI